MSTQSVAKTTPSLKSLLDKPEIEGRFQDMLGKNAAGFISSIIQVANSNNQLKVAEPFSIIAAAATAATLNLPINNSLGHAYIVPYKENYKDENGNWQKRVVAQFQIGWKGFVQLAQRSGKYSRITVLPVYENQFKSWNPMFETLDADFNLEGSGKVVGYVAAFGLLNGFTKVNFWTVDKVRKHGQQYSKSFGGSKSAWQTNFDAMALKTVLKNTLSKYGPMSIEMQTASRYDQSVVDSIGGEPRYIDNEKTVIDIEATGDEKQRVRLLKWISEAQTVEALDQVKDDAHQFDAQEEFDARKKAILDAAIETAAANPTTINPE